MDKMTDAERDAAVRLLRAIKAWWAAPVGHDDVELDELAEAFDQIRGMVK